MLEPMGCASFFNVQPENRNFWFIHGWASDADPDARRQALALQL
ncbi:MAG: hypothetical protein RMJ51_03110 [Candidatus Calescibacterium sp.]|nr:hypothetical protein [Candidatus Calescibacterium sp.]MDW8195215.1 hypothetical protein [Candidatus Calescibacterium sp.]